MEDLVTKKILNIVATQLGKKVEDLTLESTFDDLGADSLDVVEIVLTFEDEFNIELPDDEASDVNTIGDAVALLTKVVNTAQAK